MVENNEFINVFRGYYSQLNEMSLTSGNEHIFKPTTKGTQALTEISIPIENRGFKEFIMNLYILLYEGTGNGKRLPIQLDKSDVFPKIKALRNYYVHDQEHGKQNVVKKRYMQIGNIYQNLTGTKTPYKSEHWKKGAIKIIKHVNKFLINVISNFDNIIDLSLN